MSDDYTLGTPIRISVTWTVSGTPTDPTTVVLRYQRRDFAESVVTYGQGQTIVKASAGNYYADIAPDGLGKWRYRWEGTGAAAAAAEGSFRVISAYFLSPVP